MRIFLVVGGIALALMAVGALRIELRRRAERSPQSFGFGVGSAVLTLGLSIAMVVVGIAA